MESENGCAECVARLAKDGRSPFIRILSVSFSLYISLSSFMGGCENGEKKKVRFTYP